MLSHGLTHLSDGAAAAGVGGQGDRIDIQIHRFLNGTDVAIGVSKGSPDNTDIYAKGLVAEYLAAIELEEFDH